MQALVPRVFSSSASLSLSFISPMLSFFFCHTASNWCVRMGNRLHVMMKDLLRANPDAVSAFIPMRLPGGSEVFNLRNIKASRFSREPPHSVTHRAIVQETSSSFSCSPLLTWMREKRFHHAALMHFKNLIGLDSEREMSHFKGVATWFQHV